jgi:hypothetical protein
MKFEMIFRRADVVDRRILWRRIDQPGHDSARLWFQDPHWHLAGTAVFTEDRRPNKLDYQVTCDTAWNTVLGKVAGWVGDKNIELAFAADPARRWRLNETECVAVSGCIDVDLSFTPATNLLPIRRLQLPIGKEADVSAAWLRYPTFQLELLEQTYRHVDARTYRYETLAGKFVKKLRVNDAGFVTHYPGLWKIEEGKSIK